MKLRFRGFDNPAVVMTDKPYFGDGDYTIGEVYESDMLDRGTLITSKNMYEVINRISTGYSVRIPDNDGSVMWENLFFFDVVED